jgi:hypothetical protein
MAPACVTCAAEIKHDPPEEDGSLAVVNVQLKSVSRGKPISSSIFLLKFTV